MYEFKDPQGRGQAAIIAVLVWLVADAAVAIGNGLTIAALRSLGTGWSSPELTDSVSQIAAIALLATMVIAIVFVSRWIMRVNANAHAVSGEMMITPGWNVGWFFIPIASLWKPFQGLRETWQASAAPDNPAAAEVPAVMRWWWGLWVATNILGNISFRLSMGTPSIDTLTLTSWIDIVSFALDLPLTYTLIIVIRRLNALQAHGPNYAETFA